jgi:predicted N-acetyltransferase YhbS
MHPITIRDARDDEHGAISALTTRAYQEYAQRMTPTGWVGLRQAVQRGLSSNDPAEWIVAEQDGTLVGSVMLFPANVDAYQGLTGQVPWPEVRLLSVDPDARGHGIGGRLMQECIRRVRASGATEIGLHSSESLAVALHMYARLGFVRAPEFDFQPEGAELVMAFRLAL